MFAVRQELKKSLWWEEKWPDWKFTTGPKVQNDHRHFSRNGSVRLTVRNSVHVDGGTDSNGELVGFTNLTNDHDTAWRMTRSTPPPVFSVCTPTSPTPITLPLCLLLSFSVSFQLFIPHFSTDACSKPLEILSTDTTPAFSGRILDILPRIPLLVFPFHRTLTPRLSQRHDEQQVQVTYQTSAVQIMYSSIGAGPPLKSQSLPVRRCQLHQIFIAISCFS